MTCYHPIEAERLPDGGVKLHKHDIGDNFRERLQAARRYMRLPCGQCIGCRLRYSREWALRCVNEAQSHSKASFLTLTYRDSEMPQNGSLDRSDLQRFFKRVRRSGIQCRYFACGEYGEKLGRPHYHVILYGEDFIDDRVPLKKSKGQTYYTSPTLEKLWPHGFVVIGDVTFESAAYVARYVTKKVNGDLAETHYTRLDKETGEMVKISPEFTAMSLKPGIGASWLKTYIEDVFPSNEIVHNGITFPVPRYYMKLLEKENPDMYARVSKERRNLAAARAAELTFERLLEKEKVAKARLLQRVRNLESEQ